MGFVGRKPTNAPLTADDIPNGIIGAADLAAGLSKLTWDTTAKTSGFTAVSNTGYVCNTTSGEITVTLPVSPSAGDEVIIVDYAGTFATNNLIITSTPKINGSNNDVKLTTNREATRLVYIDSTQGYIAYSGVNEGTAPSLTDNPPTYSVDFLVVAGGGGGGYDEAGGGGAGGYRNSYSTETSGGGGSSETSLTFSGGTVYTVTVGAGGAAGTAPSPGLGTNGQNSEISGSDISTITSTGGGYGASVYAAANSGGSGGGGSAGTIPRAKGSGTANQGFAGGEPGGSSASGGGGGGAGAVGTNGSGSAGNIGIGGAGLASSITGSSVSRGGGGGGSSGNSSTVTDGGSGGGGNGSSNTIASTAGTVNTGGGGGSGNGYGPHSAGKAGGKGVVILRMPDAKYSGTTTGSPTVNQNVGGSGETVIIFNDSGSYTG